MNMNKLKWAVYLMFALGAGACSTTKVDLPSFPRRRLLQSLQIQLLKWAALWTSAKAVLTRWVRFGMDLEAL